ncbi:hypothetical protein BH23VER1_BH23VER1_13050 [soil metagenome]
MLDMFPGFRYYRGENVSPSPPTIPLFQLGPNQLVPIGRRSLADLGVREREDLQRVLRDHLEELAPGTMVVAEEFSEWSDSRRRIDLLGVHRDGSLVVIELKRTDDGGHMDLQAVRYAAMVSPLTFDRTVEVYTAFLEGRGMDGSTAEERLLQHLGWDSPEDGEFGSQVRIVLAGPDFGSEITTTVLWLNLQGLDIRCVRLVPYSIGGSTFLDIQQLIPLPEANDYTVRLREKNDEARTKRARGRRDTTRYRVTVGDREEGGLPKRVAIFTIVRHLVRSGVAPEDVQSALPPKQRQRFVSAPDQILEQDAFLAAAVDAEGRPIDPVRWFTGSEELLHHGGRTFAFSNQWGRHTENCMISLIEAFPDHSLRVEPVAKILDP